MLPNLEVIAISGATPMFDTISPNLKTCILFGRPQTTHPNTFYTTHYPKRNPEIVDHIFFHLFATHHKPPMMIKNNINIHLRSKNTKE